MLLCGGFENVNSLVCDVFGFVLVYGGVGKFRGNF